MSYINKTLTFENNQIYFIEDAPNSNKLEVMMDWEHLIMSASAAYITQNGGDILELGFGMGISAGYIQSHSIDSHTIYENQAFIRIPKDVLNASINPTATFTPPTNGAKLGHCGPKQSSLLPGERRKLMFVSGTAVPYITTIGLYNDENELLALGKLAQPIQKRNDIDMNFVVRWDY